MKLNIVVVQPTSLCNLDCRYCYVPDRRNKARMSDEVLATVIRKVLTSHLVDRQVQFLWHAGEPLLAGKDFYRRVIELVNQLNHRQVHVEQAIQTNATLIDDGWCDLFKTHSFKVGVSIDGPAFLHDAQRRNWGGGHSHVKAMQGYRMLRKHGIETGAICVLTKESLKHPEAIIEFFVENGFTSIAFNAEETENQNLRSSLDDNLEEVITDYRRFMGTVFDLQQKKYPHLRIRELTRIFSVLAIKRRNPDYYRIAPEIPPFGMITIQRNGDISPYCPEFAGAISPEYNNFTIGNILTNDIDDLPNAPMFLKISQDVEKSISMCAASCRYFDICGSAPLSNKYSENKTLLSTETVSCKLTYQVLSEVLLEKASLQRSVPPLSSTEIASSEVPLAPALRQT